MKSIWPNKQPSNPISNTNSKPVTEEQYNELVARTNCAICCSEAVAQELDVYKAQNLTSIGTGTISATQGNIENIDADTVQSDAMCTTTMDGPLVSYDSTGLYSNVGLQVTGCSTVQNLTADDVAADSVTADTITATTSISAPTIEVDNVVTDNFNVNNLNACCAEIASIASTNVNATCVSGDNVNATNLTSCNISGNCACFTCGNISNLKVTNELQANFQTHNITPQTINEIDDFYIILPRFTNGDYNIEARSDTDERLWSMEFDNSQENLRFKWSEADDYIQYVDIISDETNISQFPQVYVKTKGKAVKLYYYSNTLENLLTPSIYGEKQYEDVGEKHFDITKLAGTYMPNAIFAGDFHAESIEFDETVIDNISVAKAICTPVEKDLIGDVVSWTEGNNNDYITNVTDENDRKFIKWVSPATCVEQNNQRLISSDAAYNYNGTATDCDGCVAYPISHLNEETCVHGNIEVECNIVACCSLQSATFNDSNTTNVIECGLTNVNCDGCVVNWSRKTCDRMDELAVLNSDATLVDGKPVVYNETTNSLETTDALEIDELNVSEIHADKAYIKELDTVKEETISSTGDYVVLRANNPAAMSSTDHSGILIHNYDGNGSDAAIVADSDGVVRVGDGVPTSTTYSTLYFDKTTEKYYTDIEDPTTEVEPEGALTSWTSKDDTTDYIKYTNAVFSAIAYSSLEPVLTRSESASMTDNALLAWNASCSCAVTIPAPTCAEQVLTTCLDANDDLQYQWSDKAPGVYCFASMACYNAYTGNIPEGSEVVIADCINYLMGDNK